MTERRISGKKFMYGGHYKYKVRYADKDYS